MSRFFQPCAVGLAPVLARSWKEITRSAISCVISIGYKGRIASFWPLL